jgi:Tol biopolymer transport system component
MHRIATALAWLTAATLAHSQQPPTAYELALVSLDGQREVLGRLPGTVYAPRLSHDGTRVVFDDQADGGSTLFVAPLDDLAARRALPAIERASAFPLWSFDDRRILSISYRDNEQALFAQAADGSGTAELIASPARAPEAWTPDGRTLSFITRIDGDYAISTWDATARTTAPLLQREGSLQHSSHYSPDGRWLVYASNETGRFEVWVEPIPMNGTRHQVTQDGGEHPLWSPDGTQILFDRAAELYAVSVTTANGFSNGTPRALPIKGFAQLASYRRQFDIAADGRLLMLFPVR